MVFPYPPFIQEFYSTTFSSTPPQSLEKVETWCFFFFLFLEDFSLIALFPMFLVS